MMKKFLAGFIVALFCLCMVACVPSNLKRAEKKMEKAGYIVSVSTDSIIKDEGFVGGLAAERWEGGYEVLTALLFESTFDAKEFYEKHKDELDEADDKIIKQGGNWVYYGTEAAIEAFTK